MVQGKRFLKKEVSCRVINSLIKYLESSGYDTSTLLEDLPYSKNFLCNPFNWVDCETRDILGDRAVVLTGDKKIMYKAGLASPRLKSTTGFDHLIRLLGSPRIAYENIFRYAGFFDRTLLFNIDIVRDDMALIRMSQKKTEDFHRMPVITPREPWLPSRCYGTFRLLK